MKKSILIIAIMALLSFSIASPILVSTYSASGSTPVTASIAARSGFAYAVKNISGTSDLSSSVITVYKANTTGTTDNYTAIDILDVGAGTMLYDADPLYVLDVNTGYRFTVNRTSAAASVKVIYEPLR